MKYFLFMLLATSSIFLGAQESSNTSNHILKYTVEMADTLVNKLDDRSYDKMGKKTQVANNRLYLQHQMDTISRKIFHQELLEVGYPIKSNEELRKYIKFGMDRTPMALSLKSAIKNLAKKGYQGDNYFSVEIKIDQPTVGPMGKGIRPVVSIILRRFDATGKVQSRVQEKYKAPETLLATITRDREGLRPVGLESQKGLLAKKGEVRFDKSRKDFMQVLIEDINPVLETAIKQAVKKLK